MSDINSFLTPSTNFQETCAYEMGKGKKKKMKSKCCEKYKKKGKHCKNCPLRFNMFSYGNASKSIHSTEAFGKSKSLEF